MEASSETILMQIGGTWIQRLENGEELPKDIARVIEGLWKLGYRDSNDEYDWVPISVMRANFDRAYPGLEMTAQKFGISIRLAYPPINEKGSRRCFRWYGNRRRYRGVSGITGPGGKRTNDERY